MTSPTRQVIPTIGQLVVANAETRFEMPAQRLVMPVSFPIGGGLEPSSVVEETDLAEHGHGARGGRV